MLRVKGTTCHLCGGPDADSADHMIPVAHGGTNHIDNLEPVHHSVWPHCNIKRGTKPPEQVRAELAGLGTLPPPGERRPLNDGTGRWINSYGLITSRDW